ncbi:hypothetical protein F4778DRAFT_741330 [Xylariomycetidae sp. FL2044]|nr:hypothetical protein F4778DRAFT_741330 [Xylariomycetidae sp. FL2044]
MGQSSLLFSPAPYHILSYGTLLGTQVFHSFVNSITSFKVLERPQFAILQRALFPVYFGIQTVTPVLLALTYPGSGGLLGGPTGISGVLHESNRLGVLTPLAIAFSTGLVNLVYLLPETNKITAQRRQQEKKDGKRSWDAPPHSQEMTTLNKKFSRIHGYSSLLNLVTLAATIFYGFTLAARFD